MPVLDRTTDIEVLNGIGSMSVTYSPKARSSGLSAPRGIRGTY